MNYGFVIDQRKCIGCHACTVACKSEHDVALGVYRTHVKYVEKGRYPNTKRSFSIHRCNHCEDAPCTDICPTSALYTRTDGIVDFDNERCIGCKACMQACPYDALYIDPATNTAAKCNYCAHRLDRGYEPACVIVCPVEAIVSGDLDDAESHISQLVTREKVSVRKAEKNTVPNVFYIDADHASITAGATARQQQYVFTDQAAGVGHHAAHGRSSSANGGQTHGLDPAAHENLLITLAMESNRNKGFGPDQRAIDEVSQALERESQHASKRVYDAPAKGVLWGWEVTAYIWTKAIATGAFLMAYIPHLCGATMTTGQEITTLLLTLIFMALTGALLVRDLDRPDRFLYVLLRPNWSSWLVRGGYIIAVFCGVVTLMLLTRMVGWRGLTNLLAWPGLILAVATSVYTAFLFAQASGRDLWQAPTGSVRMLAHSVIAGGAVTLFYIHQPMAAVFFTIGLAVNLGLTNIELFQKHASADAEKAVEMMKDPNGPHFRTFILGILLGGVVPLALMLIAPSGVWIPCGLMALAGVYLSELIWVRVPQMIPLD